MVLHNQEVVLAEDLLMIGTQRVAVVLHDREVVLAEYPVIGSQQPAVVPDAHVAIVSVPYDRVAG